MRIQIDSTTDTPEQVKAAIGQLKESADVSSAQKPAPAQAEQKTAASDSGTEATEAKDEATTNDDVAAETDSDEDEVQAADDTEKEKPKKKGGFQRRIDKLNAAKAEAQRERDYWRAEALKAAGKEAGAQEGKTTEPARTMSTDEPQPEGFDSHRDYVKALAAWTVRQERMESERQQEKARLISEHQKVAKSHASRVEAFAEKHEDFFDALENLENIQASAAMQEIITTSDNGPAMLYELAKDPKEARRIAQLPPLAAARELGKIESRLVVANASADGEGPKKITKAPDPVNPVGSKGVKSSKSIYDSDLSQKDYEALRAKQRAAARA